MAGNPTPAAVSLYLNSYRRLKESYGVLCLVEGMPRIIVVTYHEVVNPEPRRISMTMNQIEVKRKWDLDPWYRHIELTRLVYFRSIFLSGTRWKCSAWFGR